METIDILKKSIFFSGLEDSELREFSERLREKKVKKNVFVIKENERTNEMYLIKEGKVNVMANNPEGKELILATMQEGDIFGELSLLDDGPRSANIVTQVDCVLLVVYRQDFFELLNRYPKVANQVIKFLCQRLRLTNRVAESFALHSVYGRLKKYLESMATPEIGGTFVITTHKSQENIAKELGCSRRMVARIFAQLKDDRFLTYHNKKITFLKKLPMELESYDLRY